MQAEFVVSSVTLAKEDKEESHPTLKFKIAPTELTTL